jgi:hypothetical protein
MQSGGIPRTSGHLAGRTADGASRQKNPLHGVRPAGSTTAYRRAGVEGTLPGSGGAVVVELAPTGRRFVAMVIDLVLAAVSLVVPALLASALQSAVSPDGSGYFLLGVWLLGFVWLSCYGAVWVALWGGTPGLLLTGLRVLRVWEGFERPTWAQALRRARFLAVMGWLIPLLNAVVVLVRLGNLVKERPYHHSSFDTVAGTVVACQAPSS